MNEYCCSHICKCRFCTVRQFCQLLLSDSQFSIVVIQLHSCRALLSLSSCEIQLQAVAGPYDVDNADAYQVCCVQIRVQTTASCSGRSSVSGADSHRRQAPGRDPPSQVPLTLYLASIPAQNRPVVQETLTVRFASHQIPNVTPNTVV